MTKAGCQGPASHKHTLVLCSLINLMCDTRGQSPSLLADQLPHLLFGKVWWGQHGQACPAGLSRTEPGSGHGEASRGSAPGWICGCQCCDTVSWVGSQRWSCGSLVPAPANITKPWVKSQTFHPQSQSTCMPHAIDLKSNWVQAAYAWMLILPSSEKPNKDPFTLRTHYLAALGIKGKTIHIFSVLL